MKYGLPYKGSKNKLAERIVDFLPEGEHLIDLFCGGCAVTHRALLTGKYPHVHINDIDWRPVRLFEDALAGRYNDEDRWISREDFFRLKDTDPYVAVVWSFGNNMRDYLYSRQIEPLKRAIHYAMFYSDYEPGRLLGHDLSFIDGIGGMQERYLAVKQYFRRLGHFQQQSFEGGRIGLLASNMQRGELQSLERGGIIPPRTVKRPSELQHWEARQRMPNSKKKEPERLQSHEQRRDLLQIAVPRTAPLSARNGGGEKLPLTSSVGDYRNVAIPEGSVIYCDIPYKGTDVYDKSVQFDYDGFYDWCSRQTQPTFISSYQMPADRFVCVQEFAHRSTLSASANNRVTERLFAPRHQA